MALTFELEERFDVPPAEVMAAMADLDNFKAWMPNFVSVEKLTDGEFGVGTKFRETRKMFGKAAAEEFEVTALEPGKRLELYIDGSKGASRKGWYRFTYTFENDGDGTKMHMDGTIGGMGWFFSLMSKLMAGTFKKAIAKDHEALRDYLAKNKAS